MCALGLQLGCRRGCRDKTTGDARALVRRVRSSALTAELVDRLPYVRREQSPKYVNRPLGRRSPRHTGARMLPWSATTRWMAPGTYGQCRAFLSRKGETLSCETSTARGHGARLHREAPGGRPDRGSTRGMQSVMARPAAYQPAAWRA